MNTEMEIDAYAAQKKQKEILKLSLYVILLVGGLSVGFLSTLIEDYFALPAKSIGIPALLFNLVGAFGLAQWILVGKEYVFPRSIKQNNKSGED